MLYITLTLLSWIFSGFLSMYFRERELKKKIILMPRQLAVQIALFVIFALIYWEYFSHVSINLGFIELGWLLIFVLFSSVSYYAVQVFYEYFSGNKLFASEKEMQEYIERLEDERF
jgi:hypothetical protein